VTNSKNDAPVFDVLIRLAETLTDDEVEAEYREDGENLPTVAGRVR
jgi:hypothetical protein